MLEGLARLAVARPKAVLAATFILMVAAFAYGSGITERPSGGGFYSVFRADRWAQPPGSRAAQWVMDARPIASTSGTSGPVGRRRSTDQVQSVESMYPSDTGDQTEA
jgi:hypothetical protein